jgi:cell division protein FtsW
LEKQETIFDAARQTNLLNKTKGDSIIWSIVLLLTLISLLAVYSSTGSLAYKFSKSNESYLFKQLFFIGLGLTVIYFIHRMNYTVFGRVAKILFWCSVPLLIYTLFFGTTYNQGSRWITLPIINMTFQTSDLAKLSLFMYMSLLLSKKQDVIKDFKKGFIPLITPLAIVCVLIAPANLSTALLIGATGLMLMFIGRVSLKHIFLVIGIAAIPVIFLISAAVIKHGNGEENDNTVKRTNKVTARVNTWISRVENFLYPNNSVADDDNFQTNQAKIAIAQGRWIGVGPGNSTQRNFMPHSYSDFIYAIINEEYGLFGGLFICFVYMVFLFRCIRLFQRCPYAYGAFLALGLSFTLVIQAIAHMAVNVNLFPVTGVTLPLVSMGGSSFLFTCLSIGIILSVARNVEREQEHNMIEVA